jgi:hypothetical protein
MKRFIAKGITVALLVAALALPLASPAFASGTGQPNQSCQDVEAAGGSAPGNASSSPGSPFNEPGINSTNGGTAGSVYAGNGVSATHANSANAVSQYDVACFQVSQPHP